MHLKREILLILLIIGAVFPGTRVRAQRPAGEVRGQVTDEQGGVINGAKITLLSPDGTQKTVNTDQQGSYAFRSLAAAAYTLRAEAKGFAAYEKAELSIAVGQ